MIAMKVFGHGTFTRRNLALRYSLGLPGVSLAILGMDNTGQIDENVELAADVQPLTMEEEQGWWPRSGRWSSATRSTAKKARVMGWQEQDEPVLVRY